MKRISINKSLIILVTFMLLSISNSKFLSVCGIKPIIEYFTFGLLVLEIFLYTYKSKRMVSKKELLYLIIVFFTFTIGILLQNLAVMEKIKLILTMITMEVFLIFSEDLLNNWRYIRLSSYGILIGVGITTIIGMITGMGILDSMHDSKIFPYVFAGGYEYKNFFAGALLSCYIGIYLFYKHEYKTKVDKVALIVVTILIISSYSRGTIILFVLFLVLEKVLTLKDNNRVMLFLKRIGPQKARLFKIISAVVSIALLILAYSFLALKSSTYLYRIRGVENYFEVHKNDSFHLIFGNAENAFGDPNNDYVQNIRKYLIKHGNIAWNGSYEMGFINIIIKNGFLGVVGYFIAFAIILRKGKRLKKEYKLQIHILISIILVSTFMESYISNIHANFGIIVYLIMNGIIGIEKNREKEFEKIETYNSKLRKGLQK